MRISWEESHPLARPLTGCWQNLMRQTPSCRGNSDKNSSQCRSKYAAVVASVSINTGKGKNNATKKISRAQRLDSGN
jgi:hypothetical protein